MIFDLLLSDGFSAFVSVFSLVGDAAVLVLAIYTLHITAISRKIEFISPSFSSSLFDGDQISVTLMNKSLHTIPIQEVIILKRVNAERKDKGVFWFLKLTEYENPIPLGGWDIKRVKMDRFTEIHNWSTDEILSDYTELFQDAVIGIKSGKKLIWIKPYKKAPLRAAKHAYKNGNYQILSVTKRILDGKVASKAVDCLICIKTKDENGQIILRRLFGITGFNDGKSVCLNESIFGYNVLSCPGNSAEEIIQTIHDSFGIAKEDIWVEMVGQDEMGKTKAIL